MAFGSIRRRFPPRGDSTAAVCAPPPLAAATADMSAFSTTDGQVEFDTPVTTPSSPFRLPPAAVGTVSRSETVDE